MTFDRRQPLVLLCAKDQVAKADSVPNAAKPHPTCSFQQHTLPQAAFRFTHTKARQSTPHAVCGTDQPTSTSGQPNTLHSLPQPPQCRNTFPNAPVLQYSTVNPVPDTTWPGRLLPPFFFNHRTKCHEETTHEASHNEGAHTHKTATLLLQTLVAPAVLYPSHNRSLCAQHKTALALSGGCQLSNSQFS